MSRSIGSLVTALLLASCAPLTFSKPADVDFGDYPSVQLALGGPDGAERQFDYLESELREHSGFEHITRDLLAPVSARLQVELTLHASGYDEELIIALLSDDEDDADITYSGSVAFRLIAADGHLVDSGLDSVQDEATSFDAAESALDLVVYHYLRPYRL